MGSRLEVWAFVPGGGESVPRVEWVQVYGGKSIVGAIRAARRAKRRPLDDRLTGRPSVRAGAVRLEWR